MILQVTLTGARFCCFMILEVSIAHFQHMKYTASVFFSVQVRLLTAPQIFKHPFELTHCCLDLRQPSISLLTKLKCLSAALQSLYCIPPFLPLCPLCIFDKLAHSKGIVKTSNLIKYRYRKRCTEAAGKEERRGDEWEECERSIKKEEDSVSEGEKRYELSVVKDNKV